MKKKVRARVNDAPMAVTSDGKVLINLTHLDVDGDLPNALGRVLQEDHEVFVGLVVPLRGALRHDLGDAFADVVGRHGRRLRTVRSARRRAR